MVAKLHCLHKNAARLMNLKLGSYVLILVMVLILLRYWWIKNRDFVWKYFTFLEAGNTLLYTHLRIDSVSCLILMSVSFISHCTCNFLL